MNITPVTGTCKRAEQINRAPLQARVSKSRQVVSKSQQCPNAQNSGRIAAPGRKPDTASPGSPAEPRIDPGTLARPAARRVRADVMPRACMGTAHSTQGAIWSAPATTGYRMPRMTDEATRLQSLVRCNSADLGGGVNLMPRGGPTTGPQDQDAGYRRWRSDPPDSELSTGMDKPLG